MPICPILKWYMYKDKATGVEKVFAINSAIEGTLTIGKKNGLARIDTDGLEKRKTFFECAADPYVKKIFRKAGVDQDYGLIVLRPGKNFSQSKIVDFISFHRHPTAFTKTPTVSRYGLSAYNAVFEEEVLKESQPAETNISTIMVQKMLEKRNPYPERILPTKTGRKSRQRPGPAAEASA